MLCPYCMTKFSSDPGVGTCPACAEREKSQAPAGAASADQTVPSKAGDAEATSQAFVAKCPKCSGWVLYDTCFNCQHKGAPCRIVTAPFTGPFSTSTEPIPMIECGQCRHRWRTVAHDCGASVDASFFRVPTAGDLDAMAEWCVVAKDQKAGREIRDFVKSCGHQSPAIAKQEAAERRAAPFVTIGALVVVVLVIIGGYKACSSGCSGCSDIAKMEQCERHIKARLKDPDSATLTYLKSYVWKSTGKDSRIEYRVRAQNSFGAFQVSIVNCNYDENGEFASVTGF